VVYTTSTTSLQPPGSRATDKDDGFCNAEGEYAGTTTGDGSARARHKRRDFLVVAPELAADPPLGISRKAAAVPRILRVRAQRPGKGKRLLRVAADWPLLAPPRTKSIMSRRFSVRNYPRSSSEEKGGRWAHMPGWVSTTLGLASPSERPQGIPSEVSKGMPGRPRGSHHFEGHPIVRDLHHRISGIDAVEGFTLGLQISSRARA